ncbi:helix-turn-helix domain-containing protein [Bradyrhizobium betae]|uniref:Transcriptional regulator n=1 Tax=Bradyrhizobium betae TaxID=244734 RepID=A0A4Q1V2B3_9BRAD|nr:helix-turn-helix domain-containing protein [Bradyrhizobium betae]RXT44264.1 transcriptional regulator [Bradyrhizobium betae]
MLFHSTWTSLPRPHSFSEFGMTAESNPSISLNEFTYRRGREIYGEKEPADYVYQVMSGAARSYRLLSDGRRQISAFHLPGDIFGLGNGVHRFTTEAVIDTAVRLVKRESLETLANNDNALVKNLLCMTTTNLQHAEDHLLLLGRKTSMERVAACLIEMDGRLIAAGVLALPMTRRDIADYLGLTIETISRSLSCLRELGVLHFMDNNQRHVVIMDRNKLAELDRQN